MAKLRLHREAAWTDMARAYVLLVDGETRGKIKQLECLEIDLGPGQHSVQMKIDWCTSPEIIINDERDVTMPCRSNTNPLLALLFVTIWRNKYIRLELS